MKPLRVLIDVSVAGTSIESIHDSFEGAISAAGDGYYFREVAVDRRESTPWRYVIIEVDYFPEVVTNGEDR